MFKGLKTKTAPTNIKEIGLPEEVRFLFKPARKD